MIEVSAITIFAIIMSTVTGLFIIAGVKDYYMRAEWFGIGTFCGVISIILHSMGSGLIEVVR